MNNTINQTKTRWLTPIVIAYTIIMLAWMMFCGIASHRADIRQRAITNTQTMQWSADSAWVKGGWR